MILVVPPLLWRWLRGRATVRFSDLRPLKGLPPGRAPQARLGGLVLRGLALAALIVAAAGPRWPDPDSRVATEGIALAMVVDVSGSMANQDFLWDGLPVTRLDAVKKVFRQLVEGGPDQPGRPSDLIALIVFAAQPETACPLTLDHEQLLRTLDAEKPRTLNQTEATSNPGDALAWALVQLQKAPTRRKAVLFLTDGESNVGPPALTPRQAAQLAGNLNIPIYAIDASPTDEDSKGDAAKAQETLEAVAKLAKGKYFRAADGEGLKAATGEIDQLERDRLTSPHTYQRHYELYPWFALTALACWILVFILEATIWRRIP